MFKTIVWATDGSEHSDRALPVAKALARQEGAELVAVHVLQRFLSGRSVSLPLDVDDEAFASKLERLVKQLEEEGLKASYKVVDYAGPQPAHEIADTASDLGADLIVVGTRGYAPIAGLMLGSVTTRLLLLASCPVVAVPPEHQPADTSQAAASEVPSKP